MKRRLSDSLLMTAGLVVSTLMSASMTQAQTAARWVDAAVTTQGATYLFQGASYLRFHNAQLDADYPRPLAGGGWQGLPAEFQAGIDAALYAADRDKTYFFKGNQYLRLTGVTVDPGYPRVLPGGWQGLPVEFHDGIDAALYSGGHVYFFKGSRYVRFTGNQLDPGYPADLPGGWDLPPGLQVEAAVSVGDKNFFFSGATYVRLTGTRADPGYPLALPGGWAGLPAPIEGGLGPALGGALSAPVAPECLLPWTTQDVIDPRIDVKAQYSLMRLFGGGALERTQASHILSAIKEARLAGVYQWDRAAAGQRALALGKSYSQLLAGISVGYGCITEPATLAPMIVYRPDVAASPDTMDAAVSRSWESCGIASACARPYVATLPPQAPKVPSVENGAPPPESGGAIGQLSVRVVAAATIPLPGVTVDVDGSRAEGRTTDSGGWAHFGLLEAGPYLVSARAPGLPAKSQAVQVAANATSSVTIDMSSGGSAPENPRPGSGGSDRQGGQGGQGPGESAGGGEGAPGSPENQEPCRFKPECGSSLFAKCDEDASQCGKACLAKAVLAPEGFLPCTLVCTGRYQWCILEKERANGCCKSL